MKKRSKIKAMLKWAKTHIKSYDMYTQNIIFSYQGSTDYKTLLGAMVTISIKILIVIYFVALFITLLSRSDANQIK
jgi:hypothetical protein